MRRRATLAALVLVAVSAAPAQAQCAACREALKSSGAGGLIRGFFFSTLILSTTPVLLMGGLAFWVARSARARATGAAPAGSPTETTTHA